MSKSYIHCKSQTKPLNFLSHEVVITKRHGNKSKIMTLWLELIITCVARVPLFFPSSDKHKSVAFNISVFHLWRVLNNGQDFSRSLMWCVSQNCSPGDSRLNYDQIQFLWNARKGSLLEHWNQHEGRHRMRHKHISNNRLHDILSMSSWVWFVPWFSTHALSLVIVYHQSQDIWIVQKIAKSCISLNFLLLPKNFMWETKRVEEDSEERSRS